jgi:hypothetical protein
MILWKNISAEKKTKMDEKKNDKPQRVLFRSK